MCAARKVIKKNPKQTLSTMPPRRQKAKTPQAPKGQRAMVMKKGARSAPPKKKAQMVEMDDSDDSDDEVIDPKAVLFQNGKPQGNIGSDGMDSGSEEEVTMKAKPGQKRKLDNTPAKSPKGQTPAKTSKRQMANKTENQITKTPKGQTPTTVKSQKGQTPATIKSPKGQTPATVKSQKGQKPANINTPKGQSPAVAKMQKGKNQKQTQQKKTVPDDDDDDDDEDSEDMDDSEVDDIDDSDEDDSDEDEDMSDSDEDIDVQSKVQTPKGSVQKQVQSQKKNDLEDDEGDSDDDDDDDDDSEDDDDDEVLGSKEDKERGDSDEEEEEKDSDEEDSDEEEGDSDDDDDDDDEEMEEEAGKGIDQIITKQIMKETNKKDATNPQQKKKLEGKKAQSVPQNNKPDSQVSIDSGADRSEDMKRLAEEGEKTLHVSGITDKIDRSDLEALSKDILHIRIRTYKHSKKKGGLFWYAFLTFKDKATAEKNLKSLQGKQVKGREIVVSKTKERRKPIKDTDPKTLYVTCFGNLKEEALKKFFPKANEIVLPTRRDGRPFGYAFVKFETDNDAKSAHDSVHGTRIKEQSLNVVYATKRKELSKKQARKKQQKQKKDDKKDKVKEPVPKKAKVEPKKEIVQEESDDEEDDEEDDDDSSDGNNDIHDNKDDVGDSDDDSDDDDDDDD